MASQVPFITNLETDLEDSYAYYPTVDRKVDILI